MFLCKGSTVQGAEHSGFHPIKSLSINCKFKYVRSSVIAKQMLKFLQGCVLSVALSHDYS